MSRLPAPADVRRERVLEDRLEHADVLREGLRDLRAVPIVERLERDRLPDPGPAFVPGLDARARELLRDGLRVGAQSADEQLVRERVALEVQPELDDLALVIDAALVVEILVAE